METIVKEIAELKQAIKDRDVIIKQLQALICELEKNNKIKNKGIRKDGKVYK